MEKWADYLVTGVRYNAARTHIDSVEVREDKGDSMGEARAWPRADVVANLARYTFITAPPSTSNPGSVVRGARVEKVVVDGKTYLRTDANKTAKDNLGNLPEF